MPPGATVQMVSKWSNIQEAVPCPKYNNVIGNFRPTSLMIEITTVRDNSEVLFQGRLTTSRAGGNHDYVDVWRSIDGGEFESLAQLLSGSDADGLLSLHENVNGDPPRGVHMSWGFFCATLACAAPSCVLARALV